MSIPDAGELQEYVGRTEVAEDVLVPSTLARLWATLDRPDRPPGAGAPLPPLAQWLYFLSAPAQAELGEDGHADSGAFLPPMHFARRMWAGYHITAKRPLTVGEAAVRQSEIAAVERKNGKTGPLLFITVRHDYHDRDGLAISESQDIVYRQRSPAPLSRPVTPTMDGGTSRRIIQPSAALLFRYSALTFNAHRIHYDLDYARAVEGYPGLIVHGPLIATLLAQLVADARPGVHVEILDFRAVKPLFHSSAFSVNLRSRDQQTFDLWASDCGETLAFKGTATIAD